MNINFQGDYRGLVKGIALLKAHLGIEISKDGIELEIIKRNGPIEINFSEKRGKLYYQDKIHFYRAIGLFCETIMNSNHFHMIEEIQFDLNGPMFDMSRNAVMNTESIKKMIRYMAMMGLNVLYLYMEDVYTIEDEPYFGYLRGRYTYDELKECDDYADIFGIEIVPCIQTLGHMEKYLRWNEAAPLRDTYDILLCDEKKTYIFIEKMIRAATSPFRSKRIHLGMDEAVNLGLGKYLKLHGYSNQFDIFSRHLKKVLQISSELGLSAMIWSDMFFHLASKEGGIYEVETEIPLGVLSAVPDSVSLVYWEYEVNEENIYSSILKKHQAFGNPIVFAGAIHIWSRLGGVDYEKTFHCTNAALNACKNDGIKQIMATMWGNEGSQSNYFNGLLGMQLFAEHGYDQELNMDKLKRRFKFCTGNDYDAFVDMTLLDRLPGMLAPYPTASSSLLWQDVLLGQLDKNFEKVDIYEHYKLLKEKMIYHKEHNPIGEFLYAIYIQLCDVLMLKGDMGLRLKKAYDRGSVGDMKEVKNEILLLIEKVEELRNIHLKQWITTYKPFGWETLDIKYGGMISRLKTVFTRIDDYLEQRINKIEELEQKRLYLDGMNEKRLISYDSTRYSRMITP